MKRDIGIDLIKFLAALLITNSHMEKFYPDALGFMATGGAIGDALFFFCSGFTLFLKPLGRFDNWYKKRISRIFPTAFTWILLSVLLFGTDMSVAAALKWSGGWFVKCIMIYYVILYIVNNLAINHLRITFVITFVLIAVCYVVWDNPIGISIYGDTYFKWLMFFIYMLFGSIVGTGNVKAITGRMSVVLFAISILSFYGVVIFSQRIQLVNNLQFISTVPLLGIVYSMYSFCNCKKAKQMFENKVINRIVMFVGGMCLEIYIVQGNLLPKMNFGITYPANYILAFAIILFCAYILKCFTKFLNQTFSDKSYNWIEIIKAL